MICGASPTSSVVLHSCIKYYIVYCPATCCRLNILMYSCIHIFSSNVCCIHSSCIGFILQMVFSYGCPREGPARPSPGCGSLQSARDADRCGHTGTCNSAAVDRFVIRAQSTLHHIIINVCTSRLNLFSLGL